jgi:hypothetical protein
MLAVCSIVSNPIGKSEHTESVSEDHSWIRRKHLAFTAFDTGIIEDGFQHIADEHSLNSYWARTLMGRFARGH